LRDIGSSIELFPNPVVDKVTVRIPADISGRELNLSLADAGGMVVYARKIWLAEGQNSVEIAVQPFWKPGVYFMKTVIGKEKSIRQLVIRRK
jgi:hypothetical protein